MTLKPCEECSHSVISEKKTCPHCGTATKNRTRLNRKYVLSVLADAVIIIALIVFPKALSHHHYK